MKGAEVLVILALVVLIFWGPAQLPKAARGLGEAMREFKKGVDGEDDNADR